MVDTPFANAPLVPATNDAAPLLDVRGLSVSFGHGPAAVRLVDNVSFAVGAGERVALVGESGSGKSVTAQALMRLNPHMQVSGVVQIGGCNLVALSDKEMTAERGASIGMVFQDPMSSLDPLMTIGDQVAETLRLRGVSAAAARARALRVLDELRVDRAAERLAAYPHEFSGGMRQRVVIAMALIGEPKVLIADEPTTALDVRVQERVLDLLYSVSKERGLAVLLITHDMGIVAGFADRVMVMYAGRIIEQNDVEPLFASPRHPYTQGLLGAIPRIDQKREQLQSIPGAPPTPFTRPPGCHFNPRCAMAMEICRKDYPAMIETGSARVACHIHGGGHA
ncbi:MAG: ABC transporter ATP-binding protein [Candidatus Kaistia colombiensis]|nr:MAG: ABC transporter ATP-binding protein [Kaistia sp.]